MDYINFHQMLDFKPHSHTDNNLSSPTHTNPNLHPVIPNLPQMEEGQLISVKNVSLSKATFVKFRAQNVDFLEVTDPFDCAADSRNIASCAVHRLLVLCN